MLKSGDYQVIVFWDRKGESPFLEWRGTLDLTTQERVSNRVGRAGKGRFGDFKSLGGRLFEMRLHFGSGYRVYFGEHRRQIIVLLTGGDKSTQRKDITKARNMWTTYLEDNP